MRGALNDGVRIPEQVAVTGIDDIAFARIFAPALTSVSLGAYERGRLAARLLLARMESPSAPLQTVTVSPTLVVRASTGSRRG
jgi:LacI family transcriptional regulator